MTAKPEPIDMSDKTLSQVLALLGWTYTASTKANQPGNRVFDAKGTDHGILRYQDCVALLRKKGLIK